MTQKFSTYTAASGNLVEIWEGPSGRSLTRIDGELNCFDRYGEATGHPISLEAGLEYIDWDHSRQAVTEIADPTIIALRPKTEWKKL